MVLVLSVVLVGHWVIGRPRNTSRGGLLELPLYCLVGFFVLSTSNGSFHSATTGVWAQGPRDELLPS